MNKDNLNKKKIGIVGFGAAGLSFFVQLIDSCIKENKKVVIYLFEKKGFARGLAYSTPYHSHILNLDIHTMSISHTKPNHFYEWFVKNERYWKSKYPEVSLDNLFPPRGLFGDYLESTFKVYIDIAKKHGIKVFRLKREISDLSPNRNKSISVVDTRRGRYIMDAILLAVGNMQSDLYVNLKNKAGYHHSPYEKVVISNKEPIIILGTRLTAIDTALYLLSELRCKNKTYMISRSGALPKIIGSANVYNLKYLNKSNITSYIQAGNISLNNLSSLFKQEIENAEKRSIDWSVVNEKIPTTMEVLNDEINTVENGVIRPWQSVLIAFYPLVPWVWSLLNNRDKILFINNYLSIWLTYLAAFPLQNAKKVANFMGSGLLEVIGGLNKVVYNKKLKGFIISYGNNSRVIGGTLINATGSGHNLNHSRLLLRLNKKMIIRENIAGGIDIDINTCRILSNNVINNIFAIGEMTYGAWLATADLGQVSRQAALVVKNLMI